MTDECKSLDGKRDHCGCHPSSPRCHWCGKDLNNLGHVAREAHVNTMIGRRNV